MVWEWKKFTSPKNNRQVEHLQVESSSNHPLVDPVIHPGRWTAGSPTNSPISDERNIIWTITSMIMFHLNLQVGTVNPSEPYTLNYPGMLFYGYEKPKRLVWKIGRILQGILAAKSLYFHWVIGVFWFNFKIKCCEIWRFCCGLNL